MAFSSFKEWIVSRRKDILLELDALDAIESPRAALFNQAVARISDRAVEIARSYTDSDSIKPSIVSLVRNMLEAAFPEGVPDAGPISADNPVKLYLSNALVLLGMALKSDPSIAVRALLKAPIDKLASTTQKSLGIILSIQAILSQLETETIGQGVIVPPTDPRLDSLELGLSQARDGAERMLANLSGQQSINLILSQQVQSFLSSSIDSVIQNTGSLDWLDNMTGGLIGGLLTTLQENIETIDVTQANVISFRTHYEESITGLYSDRSQVSALLLQISQLQETVSMARTKYPDLSSFRPEWLNSLLVMLALTRESRTEAARSIFEIDDVLTKDYTTLVDALTLIPQTDLSSLGPSLESIRSLLLGTSTGEGFQEQYSGTLSSTQNLLTLYYDRLNTMNTAVSVYPKASSSLLEKLFSIVKDSKMKFAEDALLSGDISSLMSLTLGELSPADAIYKEAEDFLGNDSTLILDIGKDLADSIALVTDFEQNDIQASQGFEESKAKAIATLKRDLINLDRVQSVLDKAEAQKA